MNKENEKYLRDYQRFHEYNRIMDKYTIYFQNEDEMYILFYI